MKEYRKGKEKGKREGWEGRRENEGKGDGGDRNGNGDGEKERKRKKEREKGVKRNKGENQA